MEWLWVVVASTVVESGTKIVDKRLMKEHGSEAFVGAVSFALAGLPLVLISIFEIKVKNLGEMLLATIAGIIFIPAVILYYKTIQTEEVSRVATLMRLVALKTLLLGAIFLGEKLSDRQWVAFGVMLIGSMLLSIEPGKKDERGKFGRVLKRVMPITALLAINSVVMGQVYRSGCGVLVGVGWEHLGMWVSLGLIGVMRLAIGNKRKTRFDRRIWLILVLEQMLRLGGSLVTGLAVADGMPISLVSVMGSLSLCWIWLLARVVLKEGVEEVWRVKLWRWGGLSTMLLGLGLLV